MPHAKIMSFEQFAAENGASRQGFGDATLHSPAVHMPKSTWKRLLARQAAKDDELSQKREELRAEFRKLVADGHIIEPALEDRLISAAAWDGPRGESAKRVLARIREQKKKNGPDGPKREEA